MELLRQLGLCKMQRIRLGQQRHQPPLVGAVVKDHDLVLAGRTELLARQAIARGDRQGALGSAHRGS